MPSSIYLTDEQKAQIVEAAIKCGFRVSRGRGSQLAQFVVMAANNASTRTAGLSPAKQPDTETDHSPVKQAGSTKSSRR